MIVSPLTGNLGNHMWIYAVTRSVAEVNGYEWGFNPQPEFDYLGGKPQMDFMNIDYGVENNYKYADRPDEIPFVWKEKCDRINYSGDIVSYYPYQNNVFEIVDNTKLYISCCQNARYFSIFLDPKGTVREWFKIKEDNVQQYERQLNQMEIKLDDDTCIINVRGGEYKGVPSVLLREKYWADAIEHMKFKNPKMRFLGVSDDVAYATRLFDFKIPVIHLSIGGDYYILNKAKNIILSNSSFGIFPTWLNENRPYVIAPMYWARHNTSEGWVSTDMRSFEWNFLNKDGELNVS